MGDPPTHMHADTGHTCKSIRVGLQESGKRHRVQRSLRNIVFCAFRLFCPTAPVQLQLQIQLQLQVQPQPPPPLHSLLCVGTRCTFKCLTAAQRLRAGRAQCQSKRQMENKIQKNKTQSSPKSTELYLKKKRKQ